MFSFRILPLFLFFGTTLGSTTRYRDPANAKPFVYDIIKKFASEDKGEFSVYIPDQIDYRINKLVGPVRHQRMEVVAISLYYTAVEIIEGVYAREKGIPVVPLSVDQAIDCTGILPHSPSDVLVAMSSEGCETEDDYGSPFYHPGDCYYESSKVVVRITGYSIIKTPDVVALKGALAKNGAPLGIMIYLSHQLVNYKGKEIISPTDCKGQQPSCSVLLVGYNTDAASGKSYWIIKNSLGTEWGDNGYLYLDVESQCSVLTNGATTVTVEI